MNNKLIKTEIFNSEYEENLKIDSFYQIICFVDLFAYQLKHFGTKKIFYIFSFRNFEKIWGNTKI